MVTIGGLTRLTGSGLSITEWDPIMGAIPPLNDAQWHDAFAKYQRIPQYLLENRGMSLEGFKGIFWWEWTHRLLGRLLGVVFFVPFVWFAVDAAPSRAREWPRMLLLFALGGLQGFIGWWMVQSGLETRVSCQPYRLAIHLGAALILLVRDPVDRRWNICAAGKSSGARAQARRPALSALVYVQMLLGALVAGLHAGLIYNTWPRHGWPRVSGRRVLLRRPGGSTSSRMPAWRSSITASAPISSAGACAFGSARSARQAGRLARAQRQGVLALSPLFQIALGIAHPADCRRRSALAALHQFTAALLFCAAVWHAYELRYRLRLDAAIA